MTLAERTGSLHGRHIDLVPIDLSMAAELATAAAIDRSSYRYTFVPDGEEAAAAYLSRLIAERDADQTVPFAHRRRPTGQLIGCTRFMELRSWRGLPDPDEVEIGGTWLHAGHQRSPVNTEAKLLMLTHAFETWKVFRVAVATDERNERSQQAITRLGATFEGVLRNHRGSWVTEEGGQPRNTALFAITDDDWPAIKQRLTDRLNGTT